MNIDNLYGLYKQCKSGDRAAQLSLLSNMGDGLELKTDSLYILESLTQLTLNNDANALSRLFSPIERSTDCVTIKDERIVYNNLIESKLSEDDFLHLMEDVAIWEALSDERQQIEREHAQKSEEDKKRWLRETEEEIDKIKRELGL